MCKSTPPISSLSAAALFVGLDEIIQHRVGEKTLGFGSEAKSKKEKRLGELLEKVQPEDLLKAGLIPEFIGRLPVLATLHELDEQTLIEILTKPKNALVKQFRRLFEMDGVELRFTEGALKAIAVEGIARQTGARGLRSILERAMLEVMYEIPSQQNVKEVVVSEEVILNNKQPLIVYQNESEEAPKAELA